MPIYFNEDCNGRHRMIKYTPEHMHCLAMFWGPLAPPNTGLIAVQRLSSNQVGFFFFQSLFFFFEWYFFFQSQKIVAFNVSSRHLSLSSDLWMFVRLKPVNAGCPKIGRYPRMVGLYVESGPSANLFSHPFLQHICDPLNEQFGLILV